MENGFFPKSFFTYLKSIPSLSHLHANFCNPYSQVQFSVTVIVFIGNLLLELLQHVMNVDSSQFSNREFSRVKQLHYLTFYQLHFCLCISEWFWSSFFLNEKSWLTHNQTFVFRKITQSVILNFAFVQLTIAKSVSSYSPSQICLNLRQNKNLYLLCQVSDAVCSFKSPSLLYDKRKILDPGQIPAESQYALGVC